MILTPHIKSGRSAGEVSPDLEKWSHLQSYLSQVIGTNIAVLNHRGEYLSEPSRVSGYCRDMIRPISDLSSRYVDCLGKACREIEERQEELYQCSHGLYYTGIKMKHTARSEAMLMIGPFLVGFRESEEQNRILCAKLNIEPDCFCDRIREIKLFSHTGMRSILDFAKALLEFIGND